MQLPPASVINSWPEPNYTNPSEVRGPTLIILSAIFIPLTIGVIITRIFTRVHISKSFGADDVFIVAASIPAITCGLITIIATMKWGWNRHVYDVPFDHLVLGLKLLMLLECLFCIGCSFTKLSLLCVTRRIMAGTNATVLKWIVLVSMAAVSLEIVVFCLVVVFTCNPVSAYWTLSFAPQNCINESAHLIASSVLNTVTDLCVVVLPIPTVLGLRLPVQQRVVLGFLFGAGFAVCIAGVVRCYYTFGLILSWDKTWTGYPLWISASIEMYLGVIAASLAPLKPFFTRYIPSILGQNSSQHYDTSKLSNPNKLAKLRPRRYEIHRGDRKNGMFDSYQTTTITSNTDNDAESEEFKHNGVMVSKFITYEETRNFSRPIAESRDTTSQSERRWK